jgi:glycosyltransferase involved in cell wall biosynthesis
MKKNILFIIPSLSAGGGEKSLVNLLAQINYNQFNVDLFLLNHEGIFMDYLPSQVRVLSLPENYKLFSKPLKDSIKGLIKAGKPNLALNRILFSLEIRRTKDISKREQYTWKYLSKSLDSIDKKYDVAIGFLEKTSTYFCVDKVNAQRKIGWVHIDYDKLGMDPAFDSPYFEALTSIVTVSEECANIFVKRFPAQKDKVKVIYNVVSPTAIHEMANQTVESRLDKKDNEINLLTIGRLHYQKGLELAIDACKVLVEKGYNIKWYVIGEGDEREKLTALINNNGVSNHFFLLGLKANPYPYVKQADIYVQPSRFEGKSIALDEAKILQKPIVITNFSTATDQITHGVDGMIVDMDPISVADGIQNLILNEENRRILRDNLKKLKLGTEAEIEKLYKIF